MLRSALVLHENTTNPVFHRLSMLVTLPFRRCGVWDKGPRKKAEGFLEVDKRDVPTHLHSAESNMMLSHLARQFVKYDEFNAKVYWLLGHRGLQRSSWAQLPAHMVVGTNADILSDYRSDLAGCICRELNMHRLYHPE